MAGEELNWTLGGEVGAGPISKLCNNKQQSLGPEWIISKVVTPPPHNFYKPHVLVASNNYYNYSMTKYFNV